MKKLIFTIYMLLLFTLAAVAHPNHVQSPIEKTVVVVKKVDQAVVVRKRAQVRQHRRIHRRAEVRAVRRHARIHKRHANHCK